MILYCKYINILHGISALSINSLFTIQDVTPFFQNRHGYPRPALMTGYLPNTVTYPIVAAYPELSYQMSVFRLYLSKNKIANPFPSYLLKGQFSY